MYAPKDGQRLLITLTNGTDSFNVYVPKGGVPKNMAAVLAAVTPQLKAGVWVPGETAADIVAAIDPKARVQLVTERRFLEFLNRSDARLVIDWCWSKGHIFKWRNVYPDGKESQVFSGKLVEFTEWAAKQNGLEGYVYQTVKFKYMGGSNPGSIRTVRVEQILDDAIGGYDLDKKMDLKKAYRNYLLDKIEGDITLVA